MAHQRPLFGVGAALALNLIAWDAAAQSTTAPQTGESGTVTKPSPDASNRISPPGIHRIEPRIDTPAQRRQWLQREEIASPSPPITQVAPLPAQAITPSAEPSTRKAP